MFIKYLENIHNIQNCQSIVRISENEILLIGIFNSSLLFKDTKTRDWVISHIWAQLKNKEEFLDLDADIEAFHISEIYKL